MSVYLQVDSAIQETKNLMNIIAKVVTICFICATKVSRLLFIHDLLNIVVKMVSVLHLCY